MRMSPRPRSTFPGIGRATRNTDLSAVEIASSRSALDRDLAPFRAAIGAGVPIVMISNATYPALDTKPAPWSPRVQALLRGELGFKGVTISDALDGAAATRGRTLPSVSVLAAQAGVDLILLTGSESSSAAVFDRLVAAAARGAARRGVAATELRPDPGPQGHLRLSAGGRCSRSLRSGHIFRRLT